MCWSPSPTLWTPQRRGVEETIAALKDGKDVCLYSPTGGGKTEQAIELLRWARSQSWTGAFYVNRKLLVGQTAQRFSKAGLAFGVKAADYEDMYRFGAPFQIVSADTERARCYERAVWPKERADLVIVDEAHIQKTGTMQGILAHHRAGGARVVLLTATPVGLSDWADTLVVSGKLQEYRDCKALVYARVFSLSQPDLRKVKRNATGEFVLDGQKKKLYTQSIVGDVIDNWRKHNPDAKPTMLYAPGKPESVWFTEQFHKLGVNWCHVDATEAVVDGKRAKLTRALWEEILDRYRAGEIKGLSSRFKLREGIDVPGTFMCILATPIGSLASYVQTVGRVLRYSPETPQEVIVTDHGGNYLRHGSPNHDRDWNLLWSMPESAVSEYHTNKIRNGEIPEPIRCPKCGGERATGIVCPHCKFTHEKSKRLVRQENGNLIELDGSMIKLRRVTRKPDTEHLWAKMFWGYRKKGVNQSFAQMYAYFFHTYHYYPPRDIPFMPKREQDWYVRPKDVAMGDLTARTDT